MSFIFRSLMTVATMCWMAQATPAHSQDYPTRAVKIIVPYSAGGQADVGVRVVANALSQQFGQAFVVENVGGAGGVVGIQAGIRAAPDGYTLVYSDAGQWAINPALNSKIAYDIQRDLTPVGLFGFTALFLVANSSFPANNLQELVAEIRAKPDFYAYGSSGIGTAHHLSIAEFTSALGLKVRHIPYKGSAQSIPAVASGEVSFGIAAYGGIAGFVKDGRLKLIAVNSKGRSAFAPQAPPMADAGVPDFDQAGSLGLMAPIGTPKAIVEKLSAAIAKAVASPEVVARFVQIGLEPPASSSLERMAEVIRADKAKFARVVKLSGAATE